MLRSTLFGTSLFRAAPLPPLTCLRPKAIRMAAHRDKRWKAELTTTAVAAETSDSAKEHVKPRAQQQTKKPKAAAPPPTPIAPGPLPADLSVWDNAMLLIDKPKGWTSFDVCNKLRGSLGGLLGRKNRTIKVGHAGTLDPMATGLLIVCVGRATKSIDSFVAMQKEYSGILRLGVATNSYDAEGDVAEEKPWDHITDTELTAARDGFLGEIAQIPPMFSAIRVDGKRLYEAARAGKEVERKARAVTVARFDLERESSAAQDVRFYVSCSKGTYVRSLAHDLGAAAGTAAHLTALRREAIGEFRVEGAWAMEALSAGLKEAQERAAGGGKVEQLGARQAVAAAAGAGEVAV